MTPFLNTTFKCDGEQSSHDIFTMYSIRKEKNKQIETIVHEELIHPHHQT